MRNKNVLLKTIMALTLLFSNVSAVHAEEADEPVSEEITAEVTEITEEPVSESMEETAEEEAGGNDTDAVSEAAEESAEEMTEETSDIETEVVSGTAETETEKTVTDQEETDETAAAEEPAEEEPEIPDEGEPASEEVMPEEETADSDGVYGMDEPAVSDKDYSRVMAEDSYPNIFTGIKSYTYKQTEGRKILALVNEFRTSGNAWVWNRDGTKTTNIKVNALEYDTALEEIAMQRAAEISVVFAHARPNGRDCFTAVYEYNGTTYYSNGENILYGSGPYGANAQSSFDMWKEENQGYSGQGHRRNMLGANFTGMGIGYASVNGYNFWVMELGRKTPVPETAPLNGSRDVEMPVHSAYITSYGSWTADPAEYWLAAGEDAYLPDITATVTVSGMMGNFSMKNAWPYAGSVVSSDTAIFTVEDNYESLHAVKIGEASLNITIPAGSSEKKFEIPVHVVTKVTGVTLDRTEAAVDRGSSIQLHAEVLPEDATVRDVIWSSSDSGIASVDSEGNVTGKKAGTAVITATTKDGGFTASCTVTVEVHVLSIAFESETYMIREGQTDVLEYTIEPADASDQSVVWSSSDPTVLEVDENGTLTAKKPGTAVITVTTNDRGRTDSIEVTVIGQMKASVPFLSYYDEAGKQNIVLSGESAEVKKGTVVSLHTETDGAEIYYSYGTAEGKYSKPFAVNEEGIAAAYAKKAGMKDSETAAFSIVLKDESVDADPGDLTEEDIQEVNEKYGGIVPDGIWAAGIPAEVTYTGNKITFDNLRVYDHKTLLDKNSYTVSYKNNINVSEETFDSQTEWVLPKKTTVSYVQITGKGNYTGKINIPFAIVKKSLEDKDVTVSDLWIKANGKVQKPVPEVLYAGKKLKYKTDYDFVYIDEGGKEYLSTEGISDAGNYTVIISGAGKNFEGTKEIALTVDEDQKTVLTAKAAVKIENWQAADGMPVTEGSALRIKVTSGKYTLDPVTYKVKEIVDGTHAGTAAAVIAGTGKADPESGIVLLGEKTVKFKIIGISIKNAAAEIPVQQYTGKNVQPDDFAVTLNETVLENGMDYEIVKYANDIKAGKASVTIRGIGKYTDIKVFQYQIAKADIADAEGIIPPWAEYSPSGAVPAFSLSYAGIALKAGTDYTVKYTGNKAAGMTASYEIKGKGNFTGQFSGTYTVIRKDLSGTTLTVNDVVSNASKKGAYYRNKYTLKDGNKAVAAKEYDKNAVAYTYKFDTRVQAGTRSVMRLGGSAVQDQDVPPAGTVICVTVPAADNGNYTGSVSAVYRVIPAGYDISKAQVQFMTEESGTPVRSLTKEYTGSAVTLREDELYLTLKLNGTVYVLQADDYEIVSYSSSIAKGTAKAVIRGTGDFGGTKTIQYKIGQQKFSLIDLLAE